MATQIERCADSILRYLQETSRKEEPAVRFYRAIIGPYYIDAGEQVFLGYSEDRIKRDGMFLLNYSAEQRPSEEGNRHDESEGGSVKIAPGLLVFTNPGEALGWIRDRRYSPGLPAIGVLELPLDYFRGRVGIRVFRRYLGVEMEDTQISPMQIIDRVMSGTMETGAYYLQGARSQRVPGKIRDFERLLVPKRLTPGGKVDFRRGFREI